MTARQLAVLIAVALAATSPAAAATAMAATCPGTGSGVASVTVIEPVQGTTVNGPVTVRGSASAPVGLTRVELFVGDALKDFQIFDPPRTSVDFALRWDASEAPPGPATLALAFCGDGPARLLQAGTIELTVGPPSTPPPTPARLTRAPLQDRPNTGPLWVGAVFAAGGIAALLAVMASWRRERHPPPAVR